MKVRKRKISEDSEKSPPKKSSNKKKKSNSKKPPQDDSDSDTAVEIALEDLCPINENETAASKLKAAQGLDKGQIAVQGMGKQQKNLKKKPTKNSKESGSSSDEERWLEKIVKDPKQMTVRQRALYEKGSNTEKEIPPETLVSLPTGYKEKVMTAEALEKAQIKSQKRKQMADEKREKDKKKTMERLLKKQDSKATKLSKSKQAKSLVPLISYRSTYDSSVIVMPPNTEFPIQKQVAKDPPKPILCCIPGCGNIKSYNCSKTQVPLCSFRCYKKNVESVRNIIC